jgi:hypothetical protein
VHQVPPRAQGEPLPEAEQRAVRALINTLGEAGARQRLGVSRPTIARLAGGLPVQRGTVALVTLRLREIGS